MYGRKKYKQSIQLINIEVLPYRTTGSSGTIKPRRERNLLIYSTNPNSYPVCGPFYLAANLVLND